MYNTASEELSRELYALTSWDDVEVFSDGSVWFTRDNIEAGDVSLDDPDDNLTPMYQLGYLLRKLPVYLWSEQYQEKAHLWTRKDEDNWFAWYFVNGIRDVVSEFGAHADTPEDAAAKLAIELFKQGVLK